MTDHAKWAFGTAAVIFVVYNWVIMHPWADGSGPEPDLTADPVQEGLDEPETVEIERGGKRYTVEKTHRYEVAGEVLMSSTYVIFYTSEFFALDLGLLWGDRVEHVLENYDFNQGGRWLFWQSRGPITEDQRRYMTTHISNNHLLPAEGNWNLKKAVRWIDEGDRVRIKGYLVNILEAGGQSVVRSSLRRDDKGNGACEVIWVEEVQIGTKIYR